MSILLTAKKSITNTATNDDGLIKVTLDRAIPLSRTYSWRAKLAYYSFSRYIANVHPAYQNASFAISFDGGATYTTITMPAGLYSISSINAVIRQFQVDSGILLDPNLPAITLNANLVVGRLYFDIDTNRTTTADEIRINLNPAIATAANTAEFLGFQTTPLIICAAGTSNSFSAANTPRIDWFSNNISLRIIGVGALSWNGSQQSYEIYNISLNNPSGNEYNGPLLELPSISITPGEFLSEYQVQLMGSSANGADLPLHFLEGSQISVTFELTRIGGGAAG